MAKKTNVLASLLCAGALACSARAGSEHYAVGAGGRNADEKAEVSGYVFSEAGSYLNLEAAAGEDTRLGAGAGLALPWPTKKLRLNASYNTDADFEKKHASAGIEYLKPFNLPVGLHGNAYFGDVEGANAETTIPLGTNGLAVNAGAYDLDVNGENVKGYSCGAEYTLSLGKFDFSVNATYFSDKNLYDGNFVGGIGVRWPSIKGKTFKEPRRLKLGVSALEERLRAPAEPEVGKLARRTAGEEPEPEPEPEEDIYEPDSNPPSGGETGEGPSGR